MPYFRFEPGPCFTDANGATWRPFLIDGKQVYKMNMAAVLGEDKTSADKELLSLCDRIKEVTGCIVSPGELPGLISQRKIIKNEDNNN